MRLSQLIEQIVYHISDNPNLEPSKEYSPRLGQMGKVFYVTSTPHVWAASLGMRKYVYAVDISNLNIAKKNDYPSREDLSKWAVKKGYMRLELVKRDNGDIVLDINDKPMIRPTLTDKAKPFIWKDPMTGDSLNGLRNEYMKDHGFDGYEAEYSPDGHQIGIWNFDKIKIISKKASNYTKESVMPSQQINENRDYAVAKKLFRSLSSLAKSYINSWEIANWDQGDLSNAFESDDPVAQEIYSKGEPLRDAIRRRHGDHIKLYRGIIDKPDRSVRSDRLLFSWTSSRHMAEVFAGKDLRDSKRRLKPISNQDVQNALARYERTGFTTFYNKKYIRNRQAPQYYNIYDKHNQYVTDGDNMERDFKEIQQYVNDAVEKMNTYEGRVVEKSIPVDDIIWVLMGGNANEYIVRGHPE